MVGGLTQVARRLEILTSRGGGGGDSMAVNARTSAAPLWRGLASFYGYVTPHARARARAHATHKYKHKHTNIHIIKTNCT